MKSLCAWCGKTIRITNGRLRGNAECSFGMCTDCVARKLACAPGQLGRREVARARRMHRCGRSLGHIERILGVPQPTIVAALEAA
jgi:hypothetical protein